MRRSLESVKNLELAVDMCRRIYDLEDGMVGIRSFSLAEVYRGRKEWEKALEYYTVALNIRKRGD